jgi:hypothetical protein
MSGSPVPANGPFSMTFRLFDADPGGLLLAGVGPVVVDVDEGLYDVELPLPATLFDGTQRFLEIEIDGEVLAPRLRVASTPFAYMAEKVGGFAASELEESAEIASELAAHDASSVAHPGLADTAIGSHAALADAHREHASLEESAEIDAELAVHDSSSVAHPGLADAAIGSHAALADAHREHASLEESAEITAAVAAHETLPDPHPLYVKRSGDTVTGMLGIAAPSSDALALSAPNDVVMSFTSGAGGPQTFGWDEANLTFSLSEGLALDNARLLRWPMNTGPSAGVATFSLSKLATTPPGQEQHPDGEDDETYQFCYNCRPDGSTFQADPTQHAWNQKFEATYWNSVAQREQLEVNWNYTDPTGYKWRPFAYVLQTTANCSGGPQNGEPCISAQQIADCEGGGGVCTGDNWAKWDWDSSPFGYCGVDHSIVCKTPADCPAGSCFKTSDLGMENGTGRLISRQGIVVDATQPGTLTGNAFSAVDIEQSVEPRDTLRPFSGLVLTSTFATDAEPGSGPTSWLGIQATQIFAGATTDGRLVGERMVGVEVRQELSQTALAGTGGGNTVPVLSGMSWRLQPTGSNMSVGSVAGLRLETPDPLAGGSPIAISEFDGIRIEDLEGRGAANRAILVESQSSGDGDAGNLHMEGGGATTGHLRLGDGHVWYDAGSDVLRFKDGSAGTPPASDTDGTPLHAPAGMTDDWGEALWGMDGGSTDTATRVCAQAGLSCVSGFDLAAAQQRSCGYSNWTAPYFLAFCK